MNFAGSWYVAYCKDHYEVIAHEDLMQMPEEMYLIVFNAPTRPEATHEKERLLKLGIGKVRQKIDGGR